MSHEPVLFLDTNAFHYMRLYLGLVRKYKLRPIGKSTKDPDQVIRNEFKGRAQDNVKQGRQIVEFLRSKCESGARVVYSPITCLELVAGLLRGKAIISAAREGTPQRMWNRIDEREILARLDEAAYRAAKGAAETCEVACEAYGIAVNRADPTRMRDVWILAEKMLEYVFLDAGDSLVFASSLLEMADEVITYDRYLRSIITSIQNPGGARPEERDYFKRIRPDLVRLVAKATALQTSEVRLPRVSKVR